MQQLLRKQIKASIWRLCKTLGADKRLLQGKAAVLGFHRVIPSQGFNGLNCSPDFFEQLCIFLKKSFRVAPLLELSRSLESGSVERFQVAITFDDGYLDNFENAAPILRRHGLPATFFLTTDFIGSDTPAFWDADAGEEHPFMTWPHAEQLLEQGFDIGSHTCSHANLGKLPHGAAVQEISNAKAILEDKLGTSVSNFAYPFGGCSDITDAAVQAVKEAGNATCCSLFGGLNSTPEDAFRLKRIPMSDWYVSPAHFGGDALVLSLKGRDS